MRFFSSAAALATVAVSLQAHAFEATLTADLASGRPGAVTETFEGAPVLERSGGDIFSSASPGALLTVDGIWLVPGVSAQPEKGFVATNDHWLSIGRNGPATFSFAGGASYVGFLWGSSDDYNTVSFYDTRGGLIAAFIGGNGGLAAHEVPYGNGSQVNSTYFNFSAPSIGSVKFDSGGPAFEIDNLSVITSVPEPHSVAMMFAGLAAIGLAVGRRRG